MNIFVFGTTPEDSARDHCDRYLVKMPLETAQILCTVHYLLKSSLEIPYKPTHTKHKCVVWAKASKANYLWLIDYGLALCKFYTQAYGKEHGCLKVIEWAKCNIPLTIPDVGLTPHVTAMPYEYVVPGDVVGSYQNYFKGKKGHLAKWKLGKPAWY